MSGGALLGLTAAVALAAFFLTARRSRWDDTEPVKSRPDRICPEKPRPPRSPARKNRKAA